MLLYDIAGYVSVCVCMRQRERVFIVKWYVACQYTIGEECSVVIVITSQHY